MEFMKLFVSELVTAIFKDNSKTTLLISQNIKHIVGDLIKI